MTITRFSFPTTIHFGPGARKLVGPHLRRARPEAAAVVTDKGLAALPLLAEFMADLAAAGLDVAVFDGVFGNPTASAGRWPAPRRSGRTAPTASSASAAARRSTSPRSSALIATHAGDVLEYAWDHPQVRADRRRRCRTSSRCRRPRAPAARSAARAVDLARTTRTSSGSSSRRSILAKAVFADPELTLGLPPAVTAATGMDALTHNVESYLSPAYHPLCDGIALEGMRIAARALPTAVREPAQPRGARRHDDELDDGRDRVPEGPRRRALVRARARHGLPTCTTAWPTRS